MLAIDLHTHSTCSDGMLSPEDVVRRAAERGCQLFALTDHDNTSGLAQARAQAEILGIGWVAGVEVSVTWRKRTLHIVGLGFDPENTTLQAGLAAVRAGRTERAERIARALAAAGVPGALEGAQRHVCNPEMIGRTHFARFLVESGRAKDVGAVFRHFLSQGNPGHVTHAWATLDDAVRWIVDAGGIAVIAHPGRYHTIGSTLMEELLAEFHALGGRGVEVVSGSHTPEMRIRFAQLAERYDLFASVGSDFHASGEGQREPGLLPDLPPGPKPIWPLLSGISPSGAYKAPAG